MKFCLSFIVLSLWLTAFVRAQNVQFRDTRSSYNDGAGKTAKEQDQNLQLRNFSTDKSFEAGNVRLKSFLTRDFEGGKKAVDTQKSYISKESPDAGREALFNVGNREEVDAAFAAAEEMAREGKRSYGRASKEFPDIELIYEPKEYLGPETQKDKRASTMRNMGKPTLTVDEVRDLLNSPGSTRQDITGP